MNTTKYLADFTRNNVNALCSRIPGIHVAQKNTIRDIVSGLLKKGTPILRQLSSREKHVSAKKQSERLGRNLEKEDFTYSVNAFILQRSLSFIEKDTVIAYDLTDINKESAKQMEGIARVFDGSRRAVTNGYFLHGVGTADFLLRCELHDGEKEFLPQRRKKILEEFIKQIGTRGIWAFDRGNDDRKLFVFLEKKGLRFVVRLKKKRVVIDVHTGEERLVGDMEEGRYEVYIRDEHGKVNRKESYLLIIHHHLDSLEKEPIRLLCSTKLQEKTDMELVRLYLERWGVENSFRRVKTIYRLESIRLMRWKRLQNLIALILFVDFLSSLFYLKVREGTAALLQYVLLLYKSFLKKTSKTFNPYSFRTFLREIFPKNLKFSLGVRPRKNQSQPSLWEFFEGKMGMI